MGNLIIEILNNKEINKNDAVKLFDLEIEDLCFAAAKIRKNIREIK